MTVRFTRRALTQLNDVLDYLRADDAGAAASFSNRIQTLASLLDKHPAIGRPTNLPEIRVFRAAPYPYLVFYSARRTGGITILRIRHTARSENWRDGR